MNFFSRIFGKKPPSKKEIKTENSTKTPPTPSAEYLEQLEILKVLEVSSSAEVNEVLEKTYGNVNKDCKEVNASSAASLLIGWKGYSRSAKEISVAKGNRYIEGYKVLKMDDDVFAVIHYLTEYDD